MSYQVRGSIGALAGIALALGMVFAPAAGGEAQQAAAGKKGRLVKLALPAPQKFKTADGKAGWKLKIPGGRPLATPAVVGGIIYVGGGFGSHEFYAIDLKSGKLVWSYKTGDDGPTAAVVTEGCVAYNTESCTIYVHDAKSGKVLWHRWLGDPLMSQPAIADGKVFMAWPGKDRKHRLGAFALKTGKKLWERKIASEVITAPVVEGSSVYAATTDGTVYRFAAKDGKERWKLACKATSAPRVWKRKVYISQRGEKTAEVKDPKSGKKLKSTIVVEGFNVIDPESGKLAHKCPKAAIKAEYLLSYAGAGRAFATNQTLHAGGQMAYRHSAGRIRHIRRFSGSAATVKKLTALEKSAQELVTKPVMTAPDEGVKDAREAMSLANKIDSTAREVKDEKAKKELKSVAAEIRKTAEDTRDAAELAGKIKGKMGALKKEHADGKKHDASVGFGNAPATAKVALAEKNIGQAGVKAIWAYQGSRPMISGDRVSSITGCQWRSFDAGFAKIHWDRKVGEKIKATRPLSPAALAGDRFYAGTADGRIMCLDAGSGRTLWESKVGGNILFEPAVMAGRVVVATSKGTLISLETGNPQADGWAMWGGSARHNGRISK